jgi:replicative DNA helicase Mcm
LKAGLTTTSHNLAYGLLELLSLVGVFAVIRRKNYTYKGEKKLAYEISVLGRHAEKLLSKIKLVGKPNPDITRFSEKDAFDAVPCGTLLYRAVKSLGYSKRLAEDAGKRRAFAAMMRTVSSRGKIGRRRLERIVEALASEAEIQKNAEAKLLISKLQKILQSSLVWDQIVSIEEIPSAEKYVYDLSVDGCETFVSNNLVVHNSVMLKLASSVMPRGKYVSGSGVTGAGMTASVRKDELLGSWVLEAGALILCNKGLIAIDEFDKINKDDQIAMHEAMSVETVSIAKASIVATLPAQTAVLAGANPNLGRFDTYRPIGEQIHIPETLLSRFDLKFALRDLPDRGKDAQLADHIISSRISPESIVPMIDVDFLRKYIAYARKIESMELTQEAAQTLKNFYVEMRGKSTEGTVTITLRQYEALLRLAEASAKIRLDTKVRPEDAERSIRLMRFSLQQVGYDVETGTFDIDKAEGGIGAAQRSKRVKLVEAIESLQKASGKDVPIQDVIAEAESLGISEGEAERLIGKMKEEGLVFEPKPGFIRKL